MRVGAAGAKTNTNIYTAKIVRNLQKKKKKIKQATATCYAPLLGWVGLAWSTQQMLSNWES